MSIGERKHSLLFSPARGEKRKKEFNRITLALPSPAGLRGKKKMKRF
jgi:hypothetical protein